MKSAFFLFALFFLLPFYIQAQEVAPLIDEELPAGEYEVEFNSHSGKARNLTSGIYFYQLKAGDFSEIIKMILLK